MKVILLSLLISVIVTSLGISNVQAQFPEINTVANVTNIVDGDTFDAFPVGRVRIADVDTPMNGTPGYDEATNFLS